MMKFMKEDEEQKEAKEEEEKLERWRLASTMTMTIRITS